MEKNSTVLVVEDEEDTASLIRFILERGGCSVKLVGDGVQARRLVETSVPPDVMLLDNMLPSMTGLELLRIIRTTPEWQWVPVILLTSDSSSDTMREAATLGATEYMLKPFNPRRLMQSVQLFLQKP